jgi:hypothetical protein
MDLIFDYTQNRKTDKGKCIENYDIKLYHESDYLLLEIQYNYSYQRPKETDDEGEYTLTREVENEYTLRLDLKSANFWVFSHITTKGFFGERHGGSSKTIKNNFKKLSDLTNDAFFNGCKKSNEWGVRFKNKIEQAYELIKGIIQPRIDSDFLKTKNYYKVEVDPLYDLIVDYHLDKKKIKGHDLVYLDIQEDYPSQKFLKSNDRKFIPAVLDMYGIKTKQFVSWLNNNGEGMPIVIKTLNYFCKLFGDNYIDYMNKIDWHLHCYTTPPSKKIHTLKNETEKRNVLKLIDNWEKDGLRMGPPALSGDGSLVKSLSNLLQLRDTIESKGIDLKFTATNEDTFDSLYEEWIGLKKYITRGYKVRYLFPEEFVNYVEQDIQIGDVVYQPLILKREEDFKIEGHIMKNCMGNQFNHGSISIYVSLRKGKRWVNVQYRNGEKHMCYGKANSPTPKDFLTAIEVLSKRMKKYKTIEWVKEKYDLI